MREVLARPLKGWALVAAPGLPQVLHICRKLHSALSVFE
jgi:hypothetical protein